MVRLVEFIMNVISRAFFIFLMELGSGMKEPAKSHLVCSERVTVARLLRDTFTSVENINCNSQIERLPYSQCIS